ELEFPAPQPALVPNQHVAADHQTAHEDSYVISSLVQRFPTKALIFQALAHDDEYFANPDANRKQWFADQSTEETKHRFVASSQFYGHVAQYLPLSHYRTTSAY